MYVNIHTYIDLDGTVVIIYFVLTVKFMIKHFVH